MWTGPDLEKANRFFIDNGQRKNCILELILVKGETDSVWHIYYGRAILTNRDISDSRSIKDVDENVLAIRVTGNQELAKSFFGLMQTKTSYFLPHEFEGISRLDIATNFSFYSIDFFSYQNSKQVGLQNPSNRLILRASGPLNPEPRKLNKYRHIDDMALELFGVDLYKFNGLNNTFSFYFENHNGKIKEVTQNGVRLAVTLDFKADEKETYSGYFYPISPNYGKRIPFDINEHVDLTNIEGVTSFEIRLLKNDVLVDTYKSNPEGIRLTIPQEISKEKGRSKTLVPSVIKESELRGFISDTSLLKVCKTAFEGGKYADAIFSASRHLEVKIREKSKLTADDIGTDLITKALKPGRGILQSLTCETTSEEEGLYFLNMGIIKFHKNAKSHREINMSPEDALKIIGYIDYLLKILSKCELREDHSKQVCAEKD